MQELSNECTTVDSSTTRVPSEQSISQPAQHGKLLRRNPSRRAKSESQSTLAKHCKQPQKAFNFPAPVKDDLRSCSAQVKCLPELGSASIAQSIAEAALNVHVRLHNYFLTPYAVSRKRSKRQIQHYHYVHYEKYTVDFRSQMFLPMTPVIHRLKFRSTSELGEYAAFQGKYALSGIHPACFKDKGDFHSRSFVFFNFNLFCFWFQGDRLTASNWM